jgi:hypothetical protein
MSNDLLNTTIANTFATPAKLNIDTDKNRIIANSLAGRLPTDTPQSYVSNTKTATIDAIQKKEITEKYNILQDYIWTLSENKNIVAQHIPKLIATEYNIETSPIIQNLKAAYSLSKELIKANVSISGLGNVAAPEWAKTYLDRAASSELVKKGVGAADEIIKKIGTATKANAPDGHAWQSFKLKELYQHLYSVSKTGNQFIFPYMDDEFLNLSNNFTEGNEYLQFDGLIFNLDTKDAVSNLKKFSSLPALLSPGAFIQAPQFYNFDTDEPTVTINFPLYNIVDSYETQKNINFVKLFGLNNMAHRKDLLAVDPSRIYDIYIPGKANFPLCFVSDYKVDHLGTKKLYGNDIYPEAYNVSITFKSLIKYDVNMFTEAMNMAGKYVPPPGRSLAKSEIKSEFKEAIKEGDFTPRETWRENMTPTNAPISKKPFSPAKDTSSIEDVATYLRRP